ncbi:MAG: leucine-rich repeat protein, partial [Paludibacteraceae bacterium]|nr:leucine-rich repeat protein [Paludibacteraceae bacterium]
MRKRVLYFVSVVFVLLLTMQSVRAEIIKTYAYDDSGDWNLRMEYDTETSIQDVYVLNYYGTPTEEFAFPAQFHAKFENFDGKGHDNEADFPLQFDENFSLDQSTFGPVVKRLVFPYDVEVPAYFYSCKRYLSMGMEEEHSVLEEIVFQVASPGATIIIGDHAFSGHKKLKTVDFGDFSAEVEVGAYAFAAPYEQEEVMEGMGMSYVTVYKSELSEFKIEGGSLGFAAITKIGERAFEGCVALKEVILHNNLTALGDYAFSAAGVEEVVLESHSFTMNDNANPFSGCPIEKIYLNPDESGAGKVVMVPGHMFENVSTQFDVEINGAEESGWEHVGFGEKCFASSGIKSITLPKNFIQSPAYPAYNFGEQCFYSTYYFTQDIDLRLEGKPNWIDFWYQAFAYSHIKSIQLGNNVQQIGEEAFAHSYLSGTLTIPQYVNPATSAAQEMQIGERAFYDTQKLSEVKLLTTVKDPSDNLNILSASAFADCGAAKYELPEVQGIGYMAFAGSNIEKFVGSEKLYKINQEAFGSCKKLTSVDLSATHVQALPELVFANDEKLTEIKWPAASSAFIIKEYAFDKTGFTSLDLYATHLEHNALSNMPNLESVRFVHPNMETLPGGVFANLPKLKVMDFGQYIKHITGDVMTYCPAFDSLVITANIEDMNKDAFKSVKDQITKLIYKSTELKDVKDIDSSPFRNLTCDLYFDDAVKYVPKYAFSGMTVTNSPELRADLTFDETSFEDAMLDSLNWHYPEETVYPFAKAVVEKLAFSNMKEIKDNFFRDAYIGNLYLEGIETIGEYAFENAEIYNYHRKDRLIIPASVKEIKRCAFKGVYSDGLVFEKGEGLTIASEAFKLSGGAIFNEIYAYYDADHIPAAAEDAFDFEDKVTNFYAGNCADIDDYKAATGWKDIPVKNWSGESQYKWSFAFEGLKNEYPKDFWDYSISVNDRPYPYATVTCDNKMEIEFFEPCTDIKFVKWPDNSTDPMKYTATLTSDTVIRIVVEEKAEKLELALQTPAFADVAKLYIADRGSDWEWEEKSSVNVSTCNNAGVKVELLDETHYYFTGWYDETDKKVSDSKDIYALDKGGKLYAGVKSYPVYVSLDLNPMCWDCSSQIDHFEINGENKGTSASADFNYKDEVTIKFVGKESLGTRYILDYWEDDMGNHVSDENPYTFTAGDGYYHYYPVIKAAATYAITAKSADDALGTVTMTPETGAETSKGSGLFWEGSHIELEAVPANEHIKFVKWNDGSTDDWRNITVRQAYDYVASFKKDSFDIAVAVEGIDAKLVEITGAGRYGWNDDVELKFTLKDEHYDFVAWTWEKTYKTETTLQLKATEHLNITARFLAKTYEIKTAAKPAEGGSVTGGKTAFYGELVTLTAVPNEGYEFSAWEDDDKAAAERKVEVTGDATYTALFSLKQYTVTFTDKDGNPLQSGKVEHGKDATPPTAPEV